MISVFIVDPDSEKLLSIQKIEKNLASYQKVVGGYIELAHQMIPSKTYIEESGITSFDVYANEEGLLTDPICFTQVQYGSDVPSNPVAGSLLIAGCDKHGEMVDVDPNEMMKISFSVITKALALADNKQAKMWNSIVDWLEKSYGTAYEVSRIDILGEK